MVTHDPRAAGRADRMLHLEKGTSSNKRPARSRRRRRRDVRSQAVSNSRAGTPVMKFLLLILQECPPQSVAGRAHPLGTMVLVFVVTLVWSMLAFFDGLTTEKSNDIKAIVTDAGGSPARCRSAMPIRSATGPRASPATCGPPDSMTWQFYGGTLDQGTATRENIVFAIAMDPREDPHHDGRARRTCRPTRPPRWTRPSPNCWPTPGHHPRQRPPPRRSTSASASASRSPAQIKGHRPGVRDCRRFSARPLRRHGRHEPRLLQRRPGRLRPQARQLAAPAGRQAAEPGLAAGADRRPSSASRPRSPRRRSTAARR